MTRRKNKIKTITVDGIVRLIEGIILNTVDRASISAKWYNRNVTQSMLDKKTKNLVEIEKWLESENCDIWLEIYCVETGRNKRQIIQNLKDIVRNSLMHIARIRIGYPLSST